MDGGGDEVKVTVEKEGRLKKSCFDVLGVCCSTEVVIIEKVLKNLNGVQSVRIIIPTRTLIVVHDELLVSQSQIVKVLNLARMEANVRTRQGPNFTKKWPSPYTMACGLFLVVSLGQYAYRPLQWVAVASVAVGIYPILRKSFVAIQNLTLDINVLATMAVIGTMLLRDFLEAATIVFLFTIAEWLESRASQQATVVMSELLNMEPEKAVIAETGEIVDAADVKLCTVLAVKAGEVIPIDGIVVEGEAEVDEKMLTGESFPVVKQKDSTVLAGTMNLNGYIAVKTTSVAEDCVVSKMAKLVEEAQTNKSKTQRLIDKLAKFYTPVVLVVSICLAVIPAAMRVHNRDQWYHLALVVLVSACPCGLILSTPVATFCALSKAAKSGVLLKGGDHLETLAKVKTAAFDKTGTLTTGEFVVTDFVTLGTDLSMKTLLYWVASIESKSSHPMAKALMDYATLHSIDAHPEAVVEFHNYPGEGVHGKLDCQDIYIGNRRIAHRAHCETEVEIADSASGGKTRGYIYSGGILAGWFSLSDACRSGAVQAVDELKSMNILTVMLTGDSHAAAAQAQDQLRNAIEVVHAELLPEDKARIIKECEGPVAMVGDGINDAPALATADVGISMGIAGSALATETGNIILMSNDIRKVPKVIRLARRAYNKVIQNLILSITIKGGILALAIAGHPLVWAAVLADVGTCLLVIFNSMLLLRGINRKNSGPPKCLKDPDQIFKLPVVDVECQTTDKDIEIGSNGFEENAGRSKSCRKRCCSKTTDEAGTGSSEVAFVKNGSSIAEATIMHSGESFKKREIPQSRKSCLKECCSMEKDKSCTRFSPSPEISLGSADSASTHAGHSLETMETRVDSKSCAKGCCSKKNDKSCAGSVPEFGSAKTDAQESLEKIGTPASSKSCTKGCCGSNKRDNSVTGSSKDGTSSSVGECTINLTQESLEKVETPVRHNSCTKECCGSNKRDKTVTGSCKTETGSSVSECIKKLAPESLEKVETPSQSKICTKGCCGSNKRDNIVEECTTKLAQESLEKVEASARIKICAKGCCGSNKRDISVIGSSNIVAGSVPEFGLSNAESTKSDAQESLEKIGTPASSKSCTKGCCGSNKRDNSVIGSSKTETGSTVGECTTNL